MRDLFLLGSVKTRKCPALLIVAIGLLSLGAFHADLVAAPTISEFMARNGNGSTDDDRDRSDWIELHNPDARSWNLEGWALTDDPDNLAKWVFPGISIRPNGYLVVFASGKDRSSLGAPLHTNFRLANNGEYLALSNPDGEVVSAYDPRFPEQEIDVSFGTGQASGTETVILRAGVPARAFIPTNGDFGRDWILADFDDSDWLSGRTAVGYDYGAIVNLDVSAMRGQNPSVYVRIPFQLAPDVQIDQLILRMRYEDGFVAYLNGRQIASANAANTVRWNSTATADRPDAEAVGTVDIDISSARDLLRPGSNLLAVHGLNRALTSSDILIEPQLISFKAGELQNAGYLFSPTPGEKNLSTVPAVLPAPLISVASQVFRNSFVVSLLLPEAVGGDAEIRFTEDGTIPDPGSSLYASPVQIAGTTHLRARVFRSDGASSRVASATYIQVDSTLQDFSSDLPLIVLENFGGGRPPQNSFQNGVMSILEPSEAGRTALLSEPTIQTRVGLKVRGSSTAGRPKPSLSLEARGDYDEEVGIAPLGMPRDSDWVLWGPYNFDLTLMHNPFIYELSNQIGRYAPRTRFVEVFLNTAGGPLRANDYYGVYALTEKIKRDDDRVDVDKLFPEHDRGPEVEGGYVLKIDRADPGDSGFSAGGQTLRYVYPKEEVIERPERNAQEQFIRNFIRDMGAALNSRTFDDPETGYAKYIDVDAAIDHHLLNVVAFNVDALRLSGYMSVPRGGKLVFGPIWDFDRALGSTDGRDNDPTTWRSRSGDRGTDFFNYPWWNRMFRDIDFFQRYIDRFQGLREAQFSDAHTGRLIDQMAAELREAQQRNLDRWNQRPRSQFGRTYQGEVNHMKDWLARRMRFMESQFVDPPVFDSGSRTVAVGQTISLTSREGGDIYYTLDGTDPRQSGGGASQSATRYLGPITIDRSMQIIARVQNLEHSSLTGSGNPPRSSNWSGPVSRVFSIQEGPAPGDLEISEVHFNPEAPRAAELAIDANLESSDFEFVELRNRSSRALDLTGVRLSVGVSFQFLPGVLNTLMPGESFVLVNNLEAFALRYGNLPNGFAEYRGSLNNGRDQLELLAADDTLLERLTYDDRWYPGTDGLGFSLERVDRTGSVEDGGSAADFRPSHAIGGSPGQARAGELSPVTVVVNEVLNNSTPPAVDAIELMNRGDGPVDIGGWYLTDDLRVPKKFQIPTGQVLGPGEIVVYREDGRGASEGRELGFALSSRGEEIYVVGADAAGNLTGYIQGFEFGPLPSGLTQGPWVNSLGETSVVPFDSPTLERSNGNPALGPIIFTEIHYAPNAVEGATGSAQYEFVELTNVGDSVVQLGGTGAQSWRIRGGIDFDFPEGLTLDPGESVLIVKGNDDREADVMAGFRDAWTLGPDVKLAGVFSGRLNNGGDSLRLERTDESLRFGSDFEFYLVDSVSYRTASPWPEVTGPEETLQRRPRALFGNDPAAWFVDRGHPGEYEMENPSFISGISVGDEGVVLSVSVERLGRYVVESSPSLLDVNWSPLETFEVTSIPVGVVEIRDREALSRQRFYRVLGATD